MLVSRRLSCILLTFLPLHLHGNVVKKVVIEYFRYTYEQVGIYRLTVEDVVYVSSVAVKLFGKPCHAMRLGVLIKLCLYYSAYVTLHKTRSLKLLRCHARPLGDLFLLSFRDTKKRRTMSVYLIRGIAKRPI